jgi:site-specific DNA recombinase
VNSLPDRPVALYCRVSTEDQSERQTIQAQLDFLRQFCRLYGLTVAGEYLDDGISGTVPLDQRPEGRRLLQDARDGRFGTVLVYRTDRLARRLSVMLDAYEELERAGVAVRSATEPLDTTTPIGKFIFQLLGSLAELERSTITERMTLGRDRVARRGKWTVAKVPFGYDIDAERQLVPSQRPTPLGTEAEVAAEVFRRIAAGSTAVAEARRLNAAGVPAVNRYGNGPERANPRGWSPARITHMIHNPAYKGAYAFQSRHGPVELAVPALVPEDIWQRANAQLRHNLVWSPKNSKRLWPLRGLIRCGACGSAYTGFSSRPAHRYYRCNKGMAPEPSERCRMPVVPADWLEETVWADIREFILNPGPALADAQQQVRARLSQTTALETERQRLIKRLAELDRGRDNVLELVRRGRVTLGEAEAQLDAVAAERAQVQAELDALRAQADLAAAIEAQVAEAATLLAKLRERLEEIEAGGWEAKRPWVERFVSRITVEPVPTTRRWKRPVRVVVEYVFSAPVMHEPVVTATSTQESSENYCISLTRQYCIAVAGRTNA